MAVVTIRAPVIAHAETMTTFPADEKGSLTIRYFDDEEDKVPVSGAQFDIYQVSTIGRVDTDNGKYIPLTSEFEFVNKRADEANEYADLVTNAYDKNPEIGYHKQVTTEDGIAKLTDMPAGAYLVYETKAARYHIKTIPFLVSVPEMTAGNDFWNFDVSTEPKSNVAGDLKVTKKITGTDKHNKDDTFTFTVNIADGEYKASDANGKEITVKNGSTLKLKGGQSFTIYDIPEKSDYKVVEKTDHQGYTTTYKNQEGKITGKTETEVIITNHRDALDVITSAMANPTMLLIFAGASATLILFLIFTHKKRKEEEVKE